MTKRFAFFAGATALAAVLAAPVLSAPIERIAAQAFDPSALSSSNHETRPLRLVDSDGESGWRKMWGHGEDDDDDDDGGYGARGNNPAPVGNVAPPENGLFNKGSKPQVQMN